MSISQLIVRRVFSLLLILPIAIFYVLIAAIRGVHEFWQELSVLPRKIKLEFESGWMSDQQREKRRHAEIDESFSFVQGKKGIRKGSQILDPEISNHPRRGPR